MSSSAVIPVEGARRVIGLMGEVREIGVGSEASRQHLAESLLRLVGAASCFVVLDPAHRPDGTKGGGAKTGVNITAEMVDIANVLEERGCAFNPVHLTLMRQYPQPLREQLFGASDEIVTRRDWTRSELFNDYFRPARVDRYMTSIHHASEGNVQGFGIFRAAGDGPFSEEDRHIVHLLHLGLGRVFSPEPERVVLAPRARQTLDVLLTGASDKEIAAALHISPHTVRQYVKMILEAYGVSSRTQLMARLAGSSGAHSAKHPCAAQSR